MSCGGSEASNSVVVVGASGHGRVVLAALAAAGVEVPVVLDDDPELHGTHLAGVPVDGPVDEALAGLPRPNGGRRRAVLAVGANRARQRLAERLEDAVPDLTWATVVHPSAVIDPDARIGPGAVVMAGAVVQPGAVIGAHAIVNTAASIDHDCRVGDFAHLAPGVHLAGDVTVGEGAFLGIGAVAVPGATVGAWAVVGAGAAVVRDLPAAVTAVGVPARPLTGDTDAADAADAEPSPETESNPSETPSR